MLWRFVMICLSLAEASGSCHAEATKTTYCAHLCTTYLDISTSRHISTYPVATVRRNCGHRGHRSNCFNTTFFSKLVQQVSLCHHDMLLRHATAVFILHCRPGIIPQATC